MRIEEIAEIQAENHAPNPEAVVFDGNGVAHVEVRLREGGQRAVAILGVVEILPADEIRVPDGLPALVVQVEEAVQDDRRREGQRGVVVVELSQFVAVAVAVVFCRVGVVLPVVPVFYELVEILDFIRAQRSISLDGEPICRHPRCRQFEAEAIARLDVRRQRLADVAHCARLHKLVGVVHPIGIRADVPLRCGELIAQFVVGDALSFRRRIVAVVRKIVALRLAMAHRHRAIDAMTVVVPRKSSLRVEKMVFFVDVEVVFRIGSVAVVDEFVVVAVSFV